MTERVENGKISGPYVLTDELRLGGMVVGDCTVAEGARLNLAGTVMGDLSVLEGGQAEVHGTVTGSLIAVGPVDVHGMVNGTAAGPGLTIHAGAIVNGERH